MLALQSKDDISRTTLFANETTPRTHIGEMTVMAKETTPGPHIEAMTVMANETTLGPHIKAMTVMANETSAYVDEARRPASSRVKSLDSTFAHGGTLRQPPTSKAATESQPTSLEFKRASSPSPVVPQRTHHPTQDEAAIATEPGIETGRQQSTVFSAQSMRPVRKTDELLYESHRQTKQMASPLCSSKSSELKPGMGGDKPATRSWWTLWA